jgi:glucosyl-3-phosphoglycerate synthase
MSEFHQTGPITTLHGFYELQDRDQYLSWLENKLERVSRQRQIGLLLPCLYDEILAREVLDNIVRQINEVRYLSTIVVALGGAKEERQFLEAKAYFDQLRQGGRKVKVVWVDGPRIQSVFQKLEAAKIPVGVPGKGQSVWITLGYLFSAADCSLIALHDTDIVTYDRLFLARLIEPTANPNNDFEFCKGYYARISPTEMAMKGRTTRIFVVPFVKSLTDISYNRGYTALGTFFKYHDSFRYPLAGEFSFMARLARAIDIAYDWGLEVSTLSQVYERLTMKKIAQIDLCKNYEHKHQELSENDADKGLHRMVIDIARFFLNYMRSNGMAIDGAFIDMLQQTYYQVALGFIKRYSDDAATNGLAYDRHQEELTALYFRDFIAEAWEESKEKGVLSELPSWNRVIFSVPEIYEDVLAAVEHDNG